MPKIIAPHPKIEIVGAGYLSGRHTLTYAHQAGEVSVERGVADAVRDLFDNDAVATVWFDPQNTLITFSFVENINAD